MVVNEAGPVSGRRDGGCKALAGVLGLALAVLASPAGAVTYTVTTASDTVSSDSQCSLREAIQEANNGIDTDCGGSPSSGNDLIVFHPSVTTITLGSALPPIVSGQGTLTIDGGGNVTISGNNSVRVMEVNSGADLTLRNLTIERKGNAEPRRRGAERRHAQRSRTAPSRQNTASIFDGGGVYNQSGASLTITGSTFSQNTANIGGGVFNRGTLTLTNSTFSGNTASGNGGGVENCGTLTIAEQHLLGQQRQGLRRRGVERTGEHAHDHRQHLLGQHRRLLRRRRAEPQRHAHDHEQHLLGEQRRQGRRRGVERSLQSIGSLPHPRGLQQHLFGEPGG
ncbi:MAG: hypothetical protein KatS3mg125_2174 [Lysobacterales bacterium]|nr:MAG: hypothetical protein KatS3mg125_2174 [Xanthomonadales bacterium]